MIKLGEAEVDDRALEAVVPDEMVKLVDGIVVLIDVSFVDVLCGFVGMSSSPFDVRYVSFPPCVDSLLSMLDVSNFVTNVGEGVTDVCKDKINVGKDVTNVCKDVTNTGKGGLVL